MICPLRPGTKANFLYAITMHPELNILVVEPDQPKARDIIAALRDVGCNDVTVISSAEGLERTLTQQDPDVILIDLAFPDRATLEHMSLVSKARTRPVAMFVDHPRD